MQERYPQGPKDKWLSQAYKIAAGKITTTELDIPMLLEWLKDMNWPGAGVIAEFLLKYETALTEPVREVLKSKDTMWIYWVLQSFNGHLSPGAWESLSPNLKAIAYIRDGDGAYIECLKIINKYHLDSKKKVEAFITTIKDNYPADYEALEQLTFSN